MFIAPLETNSKFVHSDVANSCMYIVHVVNKRPLTELCAPLAICFQIANSCSKWRCNFKGLSQHGGRADFSKNPAPHSLMTTYRMNEPNFSRIHLAGQYLKTNLT
jgi:hypothetical protein